MSPSSFRRHRGRRRVDDDEFRRPGHRADSSSRGCATTRARDASRRSCVASRAPGPPCPRDVPRGDARRVAPTPSPSVRRPGVRGEPSACRPARDRGVPRDRPRDGVAARFRVKGAPDSPTKEESGWSAPPGCPPRRGPSACTFSRAWSPTAPSAASPPIWGAVTVSSRSGSSPADASTPPSASTEARRKWTSPARTSGAPARRSRPATPRPPRPRFPSTSDSATARSRSPRKTTSTASSSPASAPEPCAPSSTPRDSIDGRRASNPTPTDAPTPNRTVRRWGRA